MKLSNTKGDIIALKHEGKELKGIACGSTSGRFEFEFYTFEQLQGEFKKKFSEINPDMLDTVIASLQSGNDFIVEEIGISEEIHKKLKL